ncbi:hypothetical protein ACQJBY_035814 [Aegilops geniculata]
MEMPMPPLSPVRLARDGEKSMASSETRAPIAAPSPRRRCARSAAAGFMAGAVLLAAAAVAAAKPGAPTPALLLRRTEPLSAASLDRLQERDQARLATGRSAAEFNVDAEPGLYYTLVALGNPPNRYSLLFDTASDLTWVTCSPCTHCPTSDPIDATLKLYSPSNSSTSSYISCSDDMCKDALRANQSVCQTSDNPSSQCGYWHAYAGGTTTAGYYVSDIMHLDNVMGNINDQDASPSASVIFGCSNSRSGHEKTDGFMGFGKNAPSVFLQLSSQGVFPKAFSHCMTSSEDGGGILVLGEVVEPGVVFTPLVPSQRLYNLNMKSIAVGGQNISINSSVFTTSNRQGTIVDAGTALAYLADGVYDPVFSAIYHAIPDSIGGFNMSGTRCYSCSKRFPLIVRLNISCPSKC